MSRNSAVFKVVFTLIDILFFFNIFTRSFFFCSTSASDMFSNIPRSLSQCTNKITVPAEETHILIIYIKWKKRVIRNNWKITLHKHTSKSIDSKVNRIDVDAKRIADKLLISDRVDRSQKYGPYLKVKDHKVNSPHNPSSRFLNPCTSNIGKVSDITSSKQVNLWKFIQR